MDFICSLGGDDIFRKPCPGMWEYLQRARGLAPTAATAATDATDATATATAVTSETCNTSSPVTDVSRYSNWLYVGDAAGRPAQTGLETRKKDFNDTDLKFAINVGAKVSTSSLYF